MGATKKLRVRVLTPPAILSYPYIFETRPLDADEIAAGKKPQYSCALIFPEGSDLSKIEDAILQVGKHHYGAKVADLFRSGKLHYPLRSDAGDVAEKGYPKGSTFTNVSSWAQPIVVSRYKDPVTGLPARITDKDAVYPGLIVVASLTAYAFARKGNTGVTLGLGNLQKIRDGERLGFVRPEDEFTADLDAEIDLNEFEDDDDANADDLSDLKK